jgi:hypothetical protein
MKSGESHAAAGGVVIPEIKEAALTLLNEGAPILLKEAASTL